MGMEVKSFFLIFSIADNTPLWFLLALFFSKYMYQNIVLQSKNKDLMVLVLVILGYTIGQFVWLPFSLCPAMVSLFFIHISHQYGIHKSNKNMFVLGCMLLIWISGFMLETFSLESNTFPFYFISLVIAVCGVCICLEVAKIHLPKIIRQILLFVRRYSLLVLSVHTIESFLQPWGIIYRFISETNSTVNILGAWSVTLVRVVAILLVVRLVMELRFVRSLFIK